MAVKFGRTFTLKVANNAKGENPIYFTLPYTLEFNVSRSNRAEANLATIRLRNLSLPTRSLLRKDDTDYLNQKTVVLMAGYGTNQKIIFQGQVSQAKSWREGVDFITEISAFDGGTAMVTPEFPPDPASGAYSAGTPIQKVVDDIIAFMGQYGILKGSTVPIDGTLNKGRSFKGPPLELLFELTGNAAFIDSGQVNIIPDDAFSIQSAFEISSANGLLATPTISDQFVSVDILFEPGLAMGQVVNLISTESTQSQYNSPNFNGTYKIIGISHKAIISPTINGSAVTSLSLFNFKPSQGDVVQATRSNVIV